ncbi:MAG: hypothetical protein LBM99_03575, partial [Bacillales bacterium]|nr:hypothetical protein [Bacillales bacterium]
LQGSLLATALDNVDIGKYYNIEGNPIINKSILFKSLVGAIALDSDNDYVTLKNLILLLLKPYELIENNFSFTPVDEISELRGTVIKLAKSVTNLENMVRELKEPQKEITISEPPVEKEIIIKEPKSKKKVSALILKEIATEKEDKAEQEKEIADLEKLINKLQDWGQSKNHESAKYKFREYDDGYICTIINIGKHTWEGEGKNRAKAQKKALENALKDIKEHNNYDTMDEEVGEGTFDNAIIKLDALHKSSFFAEPFYETEQIIGENEDELLWRVTVSILEYEERFSATASTTIMAQKSAAFSMLQYILNKEKETLNI